MRLGKVGRGDANIPGIPTNQDALHNRADDGLLSFHEFVLACVRDDCHFSPENGSQVAALVDAFNVLLAFCKFWRGREAFAKLKVGSKRCDPDVVGVD